MGDSPRRRRLAGRHAPLSVLAAIALLAPLAAYGADNPTSSSRTKDGSQGRAARAAMPTTLQLLADAVAAGTLDRERTLVFSVYGAMGDSRLPAAYRGTETRGAELGRILPHDRLAAGGPARVTVS